MDAQLKAKWTAALRSDEFPQGRGRLRTKEGFCCLGVLCEVAGLQISEGGNAVIGAPVHGDDYQPIYDVIGAENAPELWKRNDGHSGHDPHTFDEIADYIEKNL